MMAMSLPVWEEWIEMTSSNRAPAPTQSLPVWEEWIEIHSPAMIGEAYLVSSRMGRVD